MKNKILEVTDLCKRYPDFYLDHIHFQLEEKKIIGLIGANGAGKSTILKLLLRIIDPDQGKIFFQGKDILVHKRMDYKRKIGYVGENIEFFSKCRLEKIKKFYQNFYPSWKENDFNDMLNKMGLKLNYKMEDLSKGMKMKFNLCLALSHHPALLLLDEPTAGLDPLVRNEILKILREQVEEYRTSVIFSSHITEDMEKISDELLFIHQGKIIDYCNTKDLISKNVPIDVYLESLINQMN